MGNYSVPSLEGIAALPNEFWQSLPSWESVKGGAKEFYDAMPGYQDIKDVPKLWRDGSGKVTAEDKQAFLQKVAQPVSDKINEILDGANVAPEKKTEILNSLRDSVRPIITDKSMTNPGMKQAAIEHQVNATLAKAGVAPNPAATKELARRLTGLSQSFGENSVTFFDVATIGSGKRIVEARAPEIQNAVGNVASGLDNFISDLGPNRIRQRTAAALKTEIGKILGGDKTDEALEAELKAAIIKTVNDTAEKKEPPADAEARKKFDDEQKKDQEALAKSAGELARKLRMLKKSQGSQAVPVFNQKIDSATPTLPVSNVVLAAGGAAAGGMMLAGDSVGDWKSIRGIAIKLGIIGAAMGTAAFINGDLTTGMFTGPKKPEQKTNSPT